jgi:hypothetical protein|tara:strand:+ start:355 stop:627 length:273 start_codon:yes stop_codon:yes gene_type:complete
MSRRKKGGDLMKLFSFRVPPKMIEEYRVFCDENCMDISKRLRRYMEKDIENWKKIKISKLMAKKAKEEKERLDNQNNSQVDDIEENDLFD